MAPSRVPQGLEGVNVSCSEVLPLPQKGSPAEMGCDELEVSCTSQTKQWRSDEAQLQSGGMISFSKNQSLLPDPSLTQLEAKGH